MLINLLGIIREFLGFNCLYWHIRSWLPSQVNAVHWLRSIWSVMNMVSLFLFWFIWRFFDSIFFLSYWLLLKLMLFNFVPILAIIFYLLLLNFFFLYFFFFNFDLLLAWPFCYLLQRGSLTILSRNIFKLNFLGWSFLFLFFRIVL